MGAPKVVRERFQLIFSYCGPYIPLGDLQRGKGGKKSGEGEGGAVEEACVVRGWVGLVGVSHTEMGLGFWVQGLRFKI